jgi:hypothetical protein
MVVFLFVLSLVSNWRDVRISQQDHHQSSGYSISPRAFGRAVDIPAVVVWSSSEDYIAFFICSLNVKRRIVHLDNGKSDIFARERAANFIQNRLHRSGHGSLGLNFYFNHFFYILYS